MTEPRAVRILVTCERMEDRTLVRRRVVYPIIDAALDKLRAVSTYGGLYVLILKS